MHTNVHHEVTKGTKQTRSNGVQPQMNTDQHEYLFNDISSGVHHGDVNAQVGVKRSALTPSKGIQPLGRHTADKCDRSASRQENLDGRRSLGSILSQDGVLSLGWFGLRGLAGIRKLDWQ